MGVAAVEQFGWSETAVGRLKALWKDGLSCSQIAGELFDGRTGPSRNAVIGKLHRLGLTGRVRPITLEQRLAKERARDAARVDQKREQRARRAQQRPSVPPRRPPPLIEPDVEIPDEAVHTGLACTLTELVWQSCRWPLGDPSSPDFRFCGATRDGECSYCARHRRMAYQPRSAFRRPFVQKGWLGCG